MDMIGKRCTVFWPEEDAWFQGKITEKGQDPKDAASEGVYNNVGWRVEYDDGDIGWVADLTDLTKIKFLDENGNEEAANLMVPVATSENINVAPDVNLETHAEGNSDRNSAVNFTDKEEEIPKTLETKIS